MWLLVIGILLVALKLAGFDPVAGWPWWWVCVPFAVTVLWWMFADATGFTSKREMSRWVSRREQRRRALIAEPGGQRPGPARRVQREDPTASDGR
ncbi:MAG: hypothetical protein RI988_1878 [Pseudomonadota bacterium]